MRPYLLKGHERPLTQLKFNREGDLLFTCAKDSHPTLWYSSDGQRVGQYLGHNGAVPTCDVSFDSSRLITASADSSAKLWEVETGECLHTFKFQAPARAVAFSLGEQQAAISTDAFMAQKGLIHVVQLPDDPEDMEAEPSHKFETESKGRTSRVHFTDGNTKLLAVSEDGFVRRYDVETGKPVQAEKIHDGYIQDLQMSEDGSHFVTASLDRTAKLVDAESLEVLKTYNTERNVNSAALSPIFDHVLIGGGQEASQVTTTSARAGRFEARFFHKIYEEEFASCRGHFGPINACAFHPDGRSFATGGEDGYVRLHHFDNDYFSARFF